VEIRIKQFRIFFFSEAATELNIDVVLHVSKCIDPFLGHRLAWTTSYLGLEKKSSSDQAELTDGVPDDVAVDVEPPAFGLHDDAGRRLRTGERRPALPTW
jgi:hypothetical protein